MSENIIPEKRGRGRPRKPVDPNKPKGHRTKAEQAAKAKKEAEKREVIAKAEELANNLTTPALVAIEKEDPYDGLTERQKMIARLRLRGLSQETIAKFLNVTQPVISKELQFIREHQSKRGTSVDQNLLIGETSTLFEEVEYKAWEIYYSGDNSEKLKALQLITQSREKHVKILMDLGKLERASTSSTVEVKIPFLEKFKKDNINVNELSGQVIHATLTPLAEPAPPEEIEDAEFEEMED